jgi:hypothetical protein
MMQQPVARLLFFTPVCAGVIPVPPGRAAGRAVALRGGLRFGRVRCFFATKAGTLADSWPCGGAHPRNTARVQPRNIGNSLGAAL